MNINHALSVQSDFSIGQSMLQVDHIIEKAKELGYQSVALVDDMSVHALIQFTYKAEKEGIKPIAGVRVRVYDDPTYRRPTKQSQEIPKENLSFICKVYAKTEVGFKGLLRLLTEANTPERFYYNPRSCLKDLLELEDVIISTGDMFGMCSHPDYENIARQLKARFGEDFYAELCPINTPLFDKMNKRAIELVGSLGCKPLVTYPFRYLDNADASTMDVMSAIASNTQLDAPFRSRQYVKEFAFVEPSAIIDRTKAAIARGIKFNRTVLDPKSVTAIWTNGIKNCEEVVQKCQYKFEKQPVSLPKLANDEFKKLCELCVEGWKKRFSKPVLGYLPPKNLLDTVYKERLGYELKTLKNMGFESYFLMVEDLVTWAKNNGVIVGPGRGSVNGSLVAYLIGIADVDPIRFGLIFERFINPERLDLPDADLDFASSRRHKVVEYLIDKYGKDYVAGISNYSTLASASALRDVGRLSGLTPLELTASKFVLKDHGQTMSLEESAKAVPELEKFKKAHPEIWKHAVKLAGTMKSFGQHAAGIVVAGEPIVNRAVLERRSEDTVVNWDKRVVEDCGLVKMDLLGLSTLDTLNIARDYIKERHGIYLNYLEIPLDDPKTLQAFANGNTTGVFQFESGGMKQLLKDIAKGGSMTFDDISAATALYRPGPMDSGLLDDYVATRQGMRSVSYDHPNMVEALKDTLGVIIYQEQVMKVSVDFAGFTNAEADKLRKAMGKKNVDEMAKMRQKFIDGAVAKSGVEPGEAGRIFDKIEAFAGYGFNKSHATAYSIISVWCAYVRVHYPAEYFAASLSIVDEDKLKGLVKDARECGIEVLPPDINLSSDRYTILDNHNILAPFNAVKGVSETTARAIVKLREKHRDLKIVKYKRDKTPVWGYDDDAPIKKRFDSLFEFQEAAAQPKTKVNSKVVESLNAIGSLASVEPTQLPARHVDRRKAQMDLLPGIIIDTVKADRVADLTEQHLKSRIIMVAQEYKQCDACDLKGKKHPTMRCGNKVKFMVVTDCPNVDEDKQDKLMVGDVSTYLKQAIKDAGLNPSDGYYTTMVKARKSDKFLTNSQINNCSKYLEEEIKLVKPSIIVALGSSVAKKFLPSVKGGISELNATAVYDPTLDATIVCGISPAQLPFDPSKLPDLTLAFEKVAEVLS
ncbi:DNA polymerase III [Acinetobacter baumannii]|uniref:DNA polymerase III subunit alpha n=1 Tax=Acinetobacter baumannii TaxID=470 RepID=UPI000583CCC5|nr:DNA polymerase III subunit alpha [Acinetobacter baumannii]KHX23843.1 DNA polymerase III [Acinetobacter baumannii]KHX32795.1 DNA polymerase III [Acinetobacter baumannii]KHX33271.1 DNA polymerase III [Acinetobacter baumannii]